MELEEGVRKRARVSGGGGGGCSAGGPDRLSSLPDCLLHTIMSFLKARQAVQTCALSTRWRHLWRSVPCLDIDFDEFTETAPASDDNSGSGDGSGSDDDIDARWPWFLDSESSDSDKQEEWDDFAKYKDWEDFEDFAVNVMRGCNVAQLDSFRMHIVRSTAPEFGKRQAAGWLRRAMKYSTPGRPPRHVGLSSGYWCLKRLHLCRVHLDVRFMTRVNSVCRSLENLELDGCRCEFQSVTSHSLKTLVLKHCRWCKLSEITSPTLKTLIIDGAWDIDHSELVIFAPAVAYLHLAVDLDHEFLVDISNKEMPSVDKASINLCDLRECGGNHFELLCSISNVTSLELSSVGTEVLGEEPRFHEFKNLRNLLLDNCDLSNDFSTLVFFLRSSPILEKLTLRRCEFPEYSNKKIGTPRVNNASSSELCGLDLLCENLKVEIIYSNGNGRRLIQLLLRVSVNLSKKNIKLTKVN